MTGGTGNDLYVVDNAGDLVIEAAGGGVDTVRSVITHILTSEVEKLILTGTGATNGTGNVLGNTLTGNASANALNGLAGNDILDGGAGPDTMTGGDGDDIYMVDDAADRAVETGATGGLDLVNSRVTFTLAAGGFVENLTLTGTAAIGGTGNSLANLIQGNDAANLLRGLGGSDTLGGAGGGDILDGGAGADYMSGGDGDDVYWVDDVGDRAVEKVATGGLDLVKSSASFTLSDHVENLTLTGAAAVDGTGNAIVNLLTGNEAANLLRGLGGADTLGGAGGNDILDGGTGADYMSGGNGNDTYIVDDAGDKAVEKVATGGTDLVRSSVTFTLGDHVENLILTGSAAIDAAGNALANALTGNNGANRLFGRGGNDTLFGGGGADGFYFDGALSASANVDDILDFNVAADTILLSRQVFRGIALNGTLSAAAFHNAAAAHDADDRILYDAATGNLFYDPDGTGAAAATLFAHVTAGTALTNLDFIAYVT
jgi:Ca2+-binding RTX toxin-like protein